MFTLTIAASGIAPSGQQAALEGPGRSPIKPGRYCEAGRLCPWPAEEIVDAVEESRRRPMGLGAEGAVGPRPPDLEDLLRRGQDRLQQLLPGGYFSGIGIALILIGAIVIWGLSGFFSVQSEKP